MQEASFVTVYKLGRFAYPEHLCAAYRARALGRRAAVLHGDGLSSTHLSLGPALHAITLHGSPPCLNCAYSTP